MVPDSSEQYAWPQFTGTAELAALGPANTVFAFAQYVFQSLQVATLRWVPPLTATVTSQASWMPQCSYLTAVYTMMAQ